MDFNKYFNNTDNKQDEQKKARLASASAVIASSLREGQEQFGWLDKHNAVYEKYGLERNSWEDLDSQLKDVQTGREKLGNALIRTLGDVGLMTLEGFANLPTLPADIVKYMMGGSQTYGNSLADWFHEKQDELDEAYKIYREDKSILDGGLLDTSWYLDNLPSIMSSLSLMIPGEAVSQGASWLGRAGRIAGNRTLNKLTKALEAGTSTSARLTRQMESAAESIDKARNWAAGAQLSKKLGLGAEVVINAGTQRLLENTNEAKSVYNANYEIALSEVNDMTEEEFFDFKRKNHIDVSTGRIDAAKYVAQKAYEEDFKDNLWNFFFDVAQVHAVKAMLGNGFRLPTNPEVRAAEKAATRNYLGKELTEAEKAFNASKRGKFINWAKTRDWNRIVFGEATEGVEEMVNYVSQEEGGHVAKVLLGQEDTSSFNDRLGSYFHDGNLWDSAFWGFLGGVIYSNAHSAVNNKLKTGVWRNTVNEARKQAINNIQNDFSTFTNDINKITSSEIYKEHPEFFTDILNNTTTKKLTDIVLNAAQSGNLNFLEEFINNEEVKAKFLESTGLTENDDFYKNFNTIINNAANLYDSNIKHLQGVISRYLEENEERDVILPQYVKMLAHANVLNSLAMKEADIVIASNKQAIHDAIGDNADFELSYYKSMMDGIAIAKNKQYIEDEIRKLKTDKKAGNKALIHRLEKELDYLNSLNENNSFQRAFTEMTKRRLLKKGNTNMYIPTFSSISASDFVAIDKEITTEDAETYAAKVKALNDLYRDSKLTNPDEFESSRRVLYEKALSISEMEILKGRTNARMFKTTKDVKEELNDLHLDTVKAVRDEYRTRYTELFDIIKKKANESPDNIAKDPIGEARAIMQQYLDGGNEDTITNSLYNKDEIKQIIDVCKKAMALSIANNTLDSNIEPIDDLGHIFTRIQNSDLLETTPVDTRNEPIEEETEESPRPAQQTTPQATAQPNAPVQTFDEKYKHPNGFYYVDVNSFRLIRNDENHANLTLAPISLRELNNGDHSVRPAVEQSNGAEFALKDEYFIKDLGFDANKEIVVNKPAEVFISSTGGLSVVKKGEVGNPTPLAPEVDGPTAPEIALTPVTPLSDETINLKDTLVLSANEVNEEFKPENVDLRAGETYSSVFEDDRYVTLLIKAFNDAFNAADESTKIWSQAELDAIFADSVQKVLNIVATEGKSINSIKDILNNFKLDTIRSVRVALVKSGRYSRNSAEASEVNNVQSMIAYTDYARRLFMASDANTRESAKNLVMSNAKNVIDTFLSSFPVKEIVNADGTTTVVYLTPHEGYYNVRLSDIFKYCKEIKTNAESVFNILVSAVEKYEDANGNRIRLVGESSTFNTVLDEARSFGTTNTDDTQTIDFRINVLDTVNALKPNQQKAYWKNYHSVTDVTPLTLEPTGANNNYRVVATLNDGKKFTIGTYAVPTVAPNGDYMQVVDGWVYKINGMGGTVNGDIVNYFKGLFEIKNNQPTQFQNLLYKIAYATITKDYTAEQRNNDIDKLLEMDELKQGAKFMAANHKNKKDLVEHLVQIIKFNNAFEYSAFDFGSATFKTSLNNWFTKVYKDFKVAELSTKNTDKLHITRRFKGAVNRTDKVNVGVRDLFKGSNLNVRVAVTASEKNLTVSGVPETIHMPNNGRLVMRGIPYLYIPRDDADADTITLVGKQATSKNNPYAKVVGACRDELNKAVAKLYKATDSTNKEKAFNEFKSLLVDIFGNADEPSLFYPRRAKSNIIGKLNNKNGFNIFIPSGGVISVVLSGSKKVNVKKPNPTDATKAWINVDMQELQDALYHIFDDVSFGVNYRYVQQDNIEIDKRKKTGLAHYTDDGKFVISIGNVNNEYESFNDFILNSNLYLTDVAKDSNTGTIYKSQPKENVVNASLRIGLTIAPTEVLQETSLSERVKNILTSDEENKAQKIVETIIADIQATDSVYSNEHKDSLNYIKTSKDNLFILPKNIIFVSNENLRKLGASTKVERFNDSNRPDAVFAMMYNSESDTPICAVGDIFLDLLKGKTESKLFAVEQLIHEQLHHQFKAPENKAKVDAIKEVLDEFKDYANSTDNIPPYIKNNINNVSLEEFVIQTITNKDWAIELNKVPTKNPLNVDSKETIFQKLVRLLCDLFGIKPNKGSLYEKEFIALGDIIQKSNPNEVGTKVEQIVKDSENIHLTDDEKYYNDGGENHARVTSLINHHTQALVLDAETGEMTAEKWTGDAYTLVSTNVGTGHDEFVRDTVNGTVDKNTMAIDNLDEKADYLEAHYPNADGYSLAVFKDQIDEFKRNEEERLNVTFVSRDVTVSGEIIIPNADNTRKYRLPIAGTLDLFAYDEDGNGYIYDMKTLRNGDNINNPKYLAKWSRQLSLYKYILETKYGIKIKSLHIIPIEVSYNDPTKTTYTLTHPELANDKTNPMRCQLSVNGLEVKTTNPNLGSLIPIATSNIDYIYDNLSDELKAIATLVEGDEPITETPPATPGALTPDEIAERLASLGGFDSNESEDEDEDEDDAPDASSVSYTPYRERTLNDFASMVEGVQTSEFSDLIMRGEIKSMCR